MQIIKGRVGGEGADHLGPAAGQGVVQGQELRRGLANGQHAEGMGRLFRQVQLAAALGEGLEAQLELLLGDGHPGQGFQPQGRLGRMQRRGQDQVDLGPLVQRAGLGDGDDRQAARGAGRLHPSRQQADLVAQGRGVQDRRLDLQVAQRRQGRIGATRRDGAPAQAIQPLGQRTGQDVVLGHDDDAGLDRHAVPFRLRESRFEPYQSLRPRLERDAGPRGRNGRITAWNQRLERVPIVKRRWLSLRAPGPLA